MSTNHELIERLARAAGLTKRASVWASEQADGVEHDDLRTFAALVAEHCAGVCEANSTRWATAEECADAIREVFKQTPQKDTPTWRDGVR